MWLLKKVVLFVCFMSGVAAFGQITDVTPIEDEIKATVINAQTNFPLESVHVINLNKVKGTITDPDGKFTLMASVNDTLYLTYLGFKPQKVRVTNDMFKFEDTKISLTELAYALEEVTVRPYALTGYLAIDVKNLPVNTSYQYSISGLNKSYEAGRSGSSAVSKVLGSIMNPADLLRNLFGKKPKQMKKLRQIKQDADIRDLLASKFDRETLTQLLQLDKMDIDDILSNCSYSRSFIQTANDLQILDAISSCYEEYKVLNRR